ncbi:MAG: alpha/beta hydrolase [Myxacorys californica WJT36-NPBG1]|jgi:predicted dienelactone hydrolase|nr:alpha/beta hydrolase [Myxacorys californica WJT36-NPBG1]
MKEKSMALVLQAGVVLSLGLLPVALCPKPAASAERLTFSYAPLEFYVSVDDLATFANEGTVTSEFAFIARRLSSTQLAELRQALQQRLNYSPVVVSRAAYTQMVETLIQRLGTVILSDRQSNGFHAIRAAVILAAADRTNGLTLINVMRHFPNREIRVDIRAVLQFTKEFTERSRYRDRVVSAIAQQADREAAAQASVDFSRLSDLRQPGLSKVTKKTLTFTINESRPTPLGIRKPYPLLVDFYLPENSAQPAPLVVYSHGFGAKRFNNEYVARHLASHGIAVALPEHMGSNLEYRRAFLEGQLSDVISPIEFISRASDITYLLDELERLVTTDADWKARLDLQKVGVMGASFGGTTALSIAGAEINQAQLKTECQPETFLFSASLPLQCYAKSLSSTQKSLRDPRVKAVLAAYPLTSAIYGEEGMGKVAIPTLIVSGSHDILMSPAIDDQIHPFAWVNTSQKYLAVLVPGTHYSSSEDQYIDKLPDFMRGPSPATGRDYLRALSAAFFQVHLNDRKAYLPYLNQAYAKTITQPDLRLSIIQSLPLTTCNHDRFNRSVRHCVQEAQSERKP